MSSSTKLSEFYERFHAARRKSGTVNPAHRLSYIAGKVGRGKRVIELGCRFGDLLAHFVDGNDVVGVDIDRNALASCRQRFGIETKVVDLNAELPFETGSFDVVVISEVLEHLPYPDITLSEILRILRPHGRIVGSVPNGTKLKNRVRFLFGGPVDVDETHLHFFSRLSLLELLNKYFQSAEVIPVAGKFAQLSGDLFGNYLLFAGDRPRSSQLR